MRRLNCLPQTMLSGFIGALLCSTAGYAQTVVTNQNQVAVVGSRTGALHEETTGARSYEFINSGTLLVFGNESSGILARAGANSSGDVSIVNSGRIETGLVLDQQGSASFVRQHGIYAGGTPWATGAQRTSGNISIIHSGAIIAQNSGGTGISAVRADAPGRIFIDTSGGTIETSGGEAASNTVTSDGIFVDSGGSAQILAGTITTLGLGRAINATAASGLVVTTVANTELSTQGALQAGILAVGGGGPVTITIGGTIETEGRAAYGVEAIAFAPGSSIAVDLAETGGLEISGAGSVGLFAASSGDMRLRLGSAVYAQGNYGAGILVVGAGNAVVDVAESAIVEGGWQSDVASTYASDEAPSAAGIILSGASGRLVNAGLISAASDRAIASAAAAGTIAPPAGATSVSNTGTITGFIDLFADAANSVSNEGTLVSRHFADTNGDGTRDTRRVAIHNLGDSGSRFDNGGKLVLGASDGATAVDGAGYVAPTVNGQALDPSFYAFSREGLLHSQFINTGIFSTRVAQPLNPAAQGGVIDLRGSAVGNSLLITSSANAQTVGTGTYLAAGGTIFLNAVLNQGLAPGGTTGSESDVFIVDRVALVGAPSLLDVTNRDGAGAFTPGNGILLVNVRDAAFSQAGAFVLNGDYVHQNETAIVAGAYAYKLRQGGVDGNDGNWYLRSTLIEDEGDIDPPLYQPGAPVYEALPGHLLALNALPTLQQRIGEVPFGGNGASLEFGDRHAWLRVSGQRGAFTSGSSTTGAAGDFSQGEIEIGAETGVYDAGDSTWFAGVNLRYGSRHTNVTSPHGDGSIDTSFLGLGATATWYHDNGFYIDNQARVTWSWSDLSSSTANRQLADNVSAFGLGLSSEVGQKLALWDDKRWTLTPQAQLSYSTADFSGFTDSFGSSVGGGRNDDLTLRLGLSIDYQDQWTDEKGRKYEGHAYGIANLKIGLLPENSVELSGVSLSQSSHRVLGEVGVGGTLKIDDRIHIFGEATVGTALNSFGDNIYGAAKVGFRVAF